MRGSRLAGGLAVLLIGVMFLLANLGYLDMSVWALVGRFWPVLLIVGGLTLLIGGSFRWFVVLVLALMIVLGTVGGPMVYGWVTGPLTNVTFTPPDSTAEVTALSVDMTLDVPTLRALQPVDTAYRVEMGYRGSEAPQVSFDIRDGVGRLVVRQAGRPQVYIPGGVGAHQQVGFGFRQDLPVDLRIKSGVTATNLDLTAYDVRSLDLDTGVGSIVVRLGTPTATTRVDIKNGVGNVELLVPREAAVRVTADAGVGARQLSDVGPRSGDTWTDERYNTAEQRLDIRITAGVGRVSLSRY